MRRKYTTNLSVDGINNVIRELDNYRENILPSLVENFISRLADVGISAGEAVVQNDHKISRYIIFKKKFEKNEDGVSGMVLATETGHITSRWMTKDGIKEADVSPLLMAEWGSGRYAGGFEIEFPDGTKGGRGTFPGQKHAFDPEGWSWYDENGEHHHSFGWKPSRPVFNAWAEMERQILETARMVFGA